MSDATRRKMVKIAYLRSNPMPPSDWWNKRSGFISQFLEGDRALSVSAFHTVCAYRRKAEGEGMRWFQLFQAAYMFTLEAASPPLEHGVVLALAPSTVRALVTALAYEGPTAGAGGATL